MEILQFLINNFLGEKMNGLKPILELLQKHNFNLQKAFSELTPELLSPIMDAFSAFMENKSPTEPVGHSFGISPIAKIADKQIVYTLNRYLSD